ncbi:Uu.00g088390.m01.CDS01 [Anthostomella pinea]|uniref:Uu.00g088390.m01.CDS01 n=1 Tax=Anthostomella pinea TaxID=933095 RepID=A0AAI8YK77_9PEZI|nr:Uu.00g088390.m01.CDS01 [Anthostomella pinea]
MPPPPLPTVSFKIEDLDKSVCFENAQGTPAWLIGSGQKIYWRACFVRAYRSPNRNEAFDAWDTCNGQAVLPAGIEVFIGGRGGQIKEHRQSSWVLSIT